MFSGTGFSVNYYYTKQTGNFHRFGFQFSIYDTFKCHNDDKLSDYKQNKFYQITAAPKHNTN